MEQYEDYPFGKQPCKPNDIIRIRGKNYQVLQIEPLFIRSNHTAITNGSQQRIAEVIPVPNRIYYFQRLSISNPNVNINLQRPEGQPHIYSDQVLQYLRGLDLFSQSFSIKFSTVQGESLSVTFQTTGTQNVQIFFYGYKIQIKQIADNVEPNVYLSDFIEIQ